MASLTPVIYTSDDGIYFSDSVLRHYGASADNQPAVAEMASRRGRHFFVAGKDPSLSGGLVTAVRYRLNCLTVVAFNSVKPKDVFDAGGTSAVLGEPIPVVAGRAYVVAGKRGEQLLNSVARG